MFKLEKGLNFLTRHLLKHGANPPEYKSQQGILFQHTQKSASSRSV